MNTARSALPRPPAAGRSPDWLRYLLAALAGWALHALMTRFAPLLSF